MKEAHPGDKESRVLLALMIIGLAMAVVYFWYIGSSQTPPTSRVDTVCQEDDPCWNCLTMGNHICGD